MTRATSEGIGWLDELLALGGADAAANAQAGFMRGFLAVLRGDPATARPTLERAAAAAREAGDLRRLSKSLAMGAVAALMDGDAAASDRLLEAAGAVPGSADDYMAQIAILQNSVDRRELPRRRGLGDRRRRGGRAAQPGSG